MQLIISASKDCYITDKIIDNKYRSKNANTGHSATLDLFKLFEESGVVESGNYVTSNISEKSALLIKFDYSTLGNLTSSILDIRNKSDFKAYLELQDVSSGLQKPFNFDAICNPLTRTFEEGFGIDVSNFDDIGSANYLTSSYLGSSPITWKSEGAAAAGGNDNTFAQASITITGVGGWDNTVGFSLSDTTNTISFLANPASATPAKVDSNNYTFGINGTTTTSHIAGKIFQAIALSKTNNDLKITAIDPDASSVVNLSQDISGLTGNTAVPLANAATRLTTIKFKGGHSTKHIDIITSASFGTTKVDLGSSTYLNDPNQDLIFDITNAVSASLKGLIPSEGFRIGFSGSYSSDSKSRFVKRFASRHVKNKLITPRLRIVFDDSISDDTGRIFVNKASSACIKVKKGFTNSNLFDNSNAQLTGNNCGILKIVSGSFTSSVSFSQVDKSSNGNRLPGVYQASFTIPGNNSYVKKALKADSSGFDVELKWQTSDGEITFLNKKSRVYNDAYSNFDISSISLAMKNRKPEYTEKEDITLICSATINGKEYLPSKLRKDPDYFYGNLYYRISELISNKELIDRDFSFSTKMSFYDDEYSATIKAGTLLTGFSYKIEFFSIINDEITDFNESFVFKVV
jgi:hypothetical protein